MPHEYVVNDGIRGDLCPLKKDSRWSFVGGNDGT
jgi:hypothetical protein